MCCSESCPTRIPARAPLPVRARLYFRASGGRRRRALAKSLGLPMTEAAVAPAPTEEEQAIKYNPFPCCCCPIEAPRTDVAIDGDAIAAARADVIRRPRGRRRLDHRSAAPRQRRGRNRGDVADGTAATSRTGPRRRRGRAAGRFPSRRSVEDSSPRNIHVAATASPRPVSVKYPRRRPRGAASTRSRSRTSTSTSRRCRGPSGRTSSSSRRWA